MASFDDFKWVATNSPPISGRTDDIWFFTPEHGWLVNANGQVCETTDGGALWTERLFVPGDGPFKPYLRCIAFANENVGWFGSLLNQTQPEGLDYDEYRNFLLHHTTNGG